MVFCINSATAFTSANRRNQVIAQLEPDKNSKVRYGADQLEARDLSGKITGGQFGMLMILRFVNQADRDSFLAGLLAFAVGQFAPVAGSWYRLHDCLHDQGGSCPPGTVTVF